MPLTCPTPERDRRYQASIAWNLNMILGEGASPAEAIEEALQEGRERGLTGRPARARVTDLTAPARHPDRLFWVDVATGARVGC